MECTPGGTVNKGKYSSYSCADHIKVYYFELQMHSVVITWNHFFYKKHKDFVQIINSKSNEQSTFMLRCG